MDQWGKLWDLARARQAKIVIDSEDCGSVTLEWPNGSVSVLYWVDGDWQSAEDL